MPDSMPKTTEPFSPIRPGAVFLFGMYAPPIKATVTRLGTLGTNAAVFLRYTLGDGSVQRQLQSDGRWTDEQGWTLAAFEVEMARGLFRLTEEAPP